MAASGWEGGVEPRVDNTVDNEVAGTTVPESQQLRTELVPSGYLASLRSTLEESLRALGQDPEDYDLETRQVWDPLPDEEPIEVLSQPEDNTISCNNCKTKAIRHALLIVGNLPICQECFIGVYTRPIQAICELLETYHEDVRGR